MAFRNYAEDGKISDKRNGSHDRLLCALCLKKSQAANKKMEKKKIKIGVAILGGGDVVFPIIAAGVMLKTLGLGAALLVTLGATLGLAYIFFMSEKRRYYPAM